MSRALTLITLLIATPALAIDTPRGIYSLGMARDIAGTPQDERLANIRNYDFISGYTLRLFWSDIEPAQGQYNFSVIDNAIAALAPMGKGLNLEILSGEEPAYVLAGASATYTDHRGGTNPVPWDAFAQSRMTALMNALSSHSVPTPGNPHALKDDPTLLSIDAAPAGLNFGVRDINSGIRSHPDYTQQKYIDAVANGVAAATNAFPHDTNFLAFFAFTDNTPGPRVDTQIMSRLSPLYNHPGQPKLDFFVENLSDLGTLPQPAGTGAGNNLLTWTTLGGDTMIQALDSWLLHTPDRDPQLASRNPATGIQLAYDAYHTRFFELYIADLDGAANGATDTAGHPLLPDLQHWNTLLTTIPEPTLPLSSILYPLSSLLRRPRR